MKHPETKIIFQVCIFMLVSISLASAQNKKNIKETIIIEEGDTIINGTKLSEVNEEKRIALRKQFLEMEKQMAEKRKHLREKGISDKNIMIERGGRPFIRKFDNDNNRVFSMEGDTTIKRFYKRFDDISEGLRGIETRGFMRAPATLHAFGGEFPDRAIAFHRERPNYRSFSYNYTDKDGISDRMDIHISNASDEHVKKIAGSEESANRLQVEDLTLFPNFSSAKMTLSFNLENKGNTSIKILDSDYKTVFSDQATISGNYFKQFNLPKNGLYYLYIKRGDASYIKRIIKE